MINEHVKVQPQPQLSSIWFHSVCDGLCRARDTPLDDCTLFKLRQDRLRNVRTQGERSLGGGSLRELKEIEEASEQLQTTLAAR